MGSRKSTRQRIDDWRENTSSHAIPDWYKAETRCGRWFWVVVLVIFVAIAAYEVSMVIINYIGSEKYTTQITQEPAQSLELPTISICYGIPWSKKAAERLNLSLDALEYFAQLFIPTVNRSNIYSKDTMNEMRLAYEAWESSPKAAAYRISSNLILIISLIFKFSSLKSGF